MPLYPEAVEELVFYFKQLPGIGKRGAERLALALLNWDKEKIKLLGANVIRLAEQVTPCPRCGALSENNAPCSICQDIHRDTSTLCVVETMSQLAAIENGRIYRGRYLVLGGRLSPLDGETGENLNFALLKQRASDGEVKEVILALSSDVEGRATAAYTAELLKDCPVTVTQPALGLPAGANISFADGATIAAAFTGRKKVES